ncbi:hypothetical protein BASA62_000313 [Batrachochytrium salamandrivorans]|nr:hypothetical protein BASA62_000313 [Batrachochytrium salamandrivorans]
MGRTQDRHRAHQAMGRYDTLQDPDTTKEGGGSGLRVREVNVELLCYTAASSLKHSHDQVLKNFGDAKSQQSVSSGPNDGTYQPTSHQIPTFTLEERAEQRRLLFLKESYDRAREEFVKHSCLTKYPGLLSKSDVKRMDMLFY